MKVVSSRSGAWRSHQRSPHSSTGCAVVERVEVGAIVRDVVAREHRLRENRGRGCRGFTRVQAREIGGELAREPRAVRARDAGRARPCGPRRRRAGAP